MKLCSVIGCISRHAALGFCHKHYSRMKANGSTEKPLRAPSQRRVDISGQRFGRLCVTAMSYEDGQGIARYVCDCGRAGSAAAYNLKSGNTTSCGCASAESRRSRGPAVADAAKRQKIETGRHWNTTHGRTLTKEYRSWRDAKKRCYSPQNKSYANYGGRGISMCDAWRESFDAFFADMGPCPLGMTLDRIDVHSDYSPKNCRWASIETQAQNKRTNKATPDIVKAIRHAFLLGASERDLAKRYAMTSNNVSFIVSGKTWKNV